MRYMKLITGGVRHHLARTDQPPAELLTLCGCAVTGPHSWTQLGALTGDECENCAQIAFGGSAGRTASRKPAPDRSVEFAKF